MVDVVIVVDFCARFVRFVIFENDLRIHHALIWHASRRWCNLDDDAVSFILLLRVAGLQRFARSEISGGQTFQKVPFFLEGRDSLLL